MFNIVPKVFEAFLSSFHSFPFILLFSSYFHHSILPLSIPLPVILLLVPSSLFLISVIVLFICLLILYFLYVLGDCINCVKCFLHFLHSLFKSWEHLYYHYSEFSFREITYFLFIYLVFWVSTFLFHLCCISVFSSSSFFFFLTWSISGLLFPGFKVLLLLPFDFCTWRETLVGWFVLISCWGDLCYVLVGGDKVGN